MAHFQKNNGADGQWLWHTVDQRTRVLIQSSATFIEQMSTICRKGENKEKEAGNGPIVEVLFYSHLPLIMFRVTCVI